MKIYASKKYTKYFAECIVNTPYTIVHKNYNTERWYMKLIRDTEDGLYPYDSIKVYDTDSTELGEDSFERAKLVYEYER